jgi:hypothetical protein
MQQWQIVAHNNEIEQMIWKQVHKVVECLQQAEHHM